MSSRTRRRAARRRQRDGRHGHRSKSARSGSSPSPAPARWCRRHECARRRRRARPGACRRAFRPWRKPPPATKGDTRLLSSSTARRTALPMETGCKGSQARFLLRESAASLSPISRRTSLCCAGSGCTNLTSGCRPWWPGGGSRPRTKALRHAPGRSTRPSSNS